MNSQQPFQFVAYIEHVKEVALYGKANLDFWRKRLKQEGLFPYDDGGQAGILISVPHLLWKGVRFTEVSISITVSEREDGKTPNGGFLVYAFNSHRFLAFMERSFFQTPYFYAEVQASEEIPAHFSVKHGTKTLFEGKMNGKRDPVRTEMDHFEGPVYLSGGRFFNARISGITDFYPFAARDVLSVNETTGEAIFRWLRESNFTGVEWRIRGDAVHGKSKTHQRKSTKF